jgi:hypothetical protein
VFKDFCDKYHIQNGKYSEYNYGLFNNNELIQVIGFNKHPVYEYECTRLCSKLNLLIVGGSSKLFKYFLKDLQPEKVLSFSDRRYFNGKIYEKLGFKLEGVTDPNYFYTKGGRVFSRIKFQKHKLHKLLKMFDPNLSESQNMFNNNYRKIWDAGHWKFIYTQFSS